MASVPLLKNQLRCAQVKQVNITYSERPWMGVVLSRNEFVKTNSQLTNVHGGTFVNDTDIQLRTSGCGNADLTGAANIAQLRLNAEFAVRQTSPV